MCDGDAADDNDDEDCGDADKLCNSSPPGGASRFLILSTRGCDLLLKSYKFVCPHVAPLFISF